ncbi:MAG: signal peptidase I [Henriciella sp.]|nr:signal peptidase I [Henriciella sp.]
MKDDVMKPDEASEAPLTLQQKIVKELREWGITLSIFVPIFLIFSGLVYELRVIPSESMVPNLQVGDRVTVNKFAYGYSRNSLPFSLGRYVPLPEGRIFAGTPERGDVAGFEHTHTPRVMIKRIIGLPGDTVIVRDGQPVAINGVPIERTFDRRIRYRQYDNGRYVTAAEFTESYDGKSWVAHDIDGETGTSISVVFQVPEKHYLFMGDNRDNSMDGRNLTGHCPANDDGVIDQAGCPPRGGTLPEQASVGFVPFQNLIGRADTVLFSFYRCSRADAEPCMKKRVWRGL